MTPRDIIEKLNSEGYQLIAGVRLLRDLVTTFPNEIKGEDLKNFNSVFTAANQISHLSPHRISLFGEKKAEITISIEDLNQLPKNLRKMATFLEQLKSSREKNPPANLTDSEKKSDLEDLDKMIPLIKKRADDIETVLATATKEAGLAKSKSTATKEAGLAKSKSSDGRPRSP